MEINIDTTLLDLEKFKTDEEISDYIKYLLILGRKTLTDDYVEWLKDTSILAEYMIGVSKTDINNFTIIMNNLKVKTN